VGRPHASNPVPRPRKQSCGRHLKKSFRRTKKKRAAPKTPNSVALQYEPTEEERAVLESQARRRKDELPAPRFNVTSDYRGTSVEPDHPHPATAQACFNELFETSDSDFVDGVLGGLSELVVGDGTAEENKKLNFGLSVFKAAKLKGPFQQLLGTHMLINHFAIIKLGKELLNDRDLSMHACADLMGQVLNRIQPTGSQHITQAQLESEVFNAMQLAKRQYVARELNRSMRTFAEQTRALKDNQAKAEPLQVQQVSVAPGGQAIVGNVTQAITPTQDTMPRKDDVRVLPDVRMSAMPPIVANSNLEAGLVRNKRQST
jgi:hypothetical protein